MATKAKLSEFNAYLTEQVGQPYVWGAQHLKLTPDNYVSVITKKESNAAYRASAIEYCKKKFTEGYTVLYAYDCSGLGMYWLQNVKHIFAKDLSANSMMGKCEITTDLKNGYWAFRLGIDGRATHIGYMVSDSEVIHAKGRAYGVVREKYKSSYWHRIGKPSCIDFDEEVQPTPEPTPTPTPEPIKTTTMIKVKGSVRVREGNGKSYPQIRPTAKNCLLPYLGQATAEPCWYKTMWQNTIGFISSDPKYTELIEVEG